MNTRHFCFKLSLIFSFIIIAGCGTGAFQVQIVPQKQNLEETQIKRDKGFGVSDKIAVIDVDGIIVNRRQDSLMSRRDNPVSLFQEKLDKAAADRNVKAVVLRLNSPGGTVGATDMMYHSLREFKRKTRKPVIACMLDLTCSGAYYLACGCDGIVAQPSTVTGSIGTIVQTFSVEGTMKKIGVKAVAIKSGKMKDMASPLHDLSDEERKVLAQIVENFYEQFLNVVDNGRTKIDKETIRQLADGRVFTAQQAHEQSLVDRIGYADDAVKWAKTLAGLEKIRLVIYHRPMGYKPNIYASAESASAPMTPLINLELPQWLDSGGAQFLYLWQPGL
jgi:protease-4